ncbi:MAG: hypothetical protein PHY08_03630 [Candidatus Cloacimonetes bacterium]|jgi:ABC-2 type transport system permease protein|nr:hypothetical protein [Candidatus Cloacimonadota bacterium]MDD4155642.1 hypothetical protein [Candidatus Cloacimonadota bacterium]
MNKILLILRNELMQFFTGLSAYIFFIVFIAINSWFFAMPLFINNNANLNSFFMTSQLLLIIFIPVITMNLLPKERQLGTIEILHTIPLKIYQIIFGKFLAGLVIIIFAILPSIIYLITIANIGINVDYGIIFCGYLSLILTSAVYCAIGIFSGSFSPNQIISFIISFIIILFFYLLDNIMIFLPASITTFLQYISITWQNSNLIKGVVDSRVLVYFISLIFVFLWFSMIIMNRKRSD